MALWVVMAKMVEPARRARKPPLVGRVSRVKMVPMARLVGRAEPQGITDPMARMA
jgi:hypothetical protein